MNELRRKRRRKNNEIFVKFTLKLFDKLVQLQNVLYYAVARKIRQLLKVNLRSWLKQFSLTKWCDGISYILICRRKTKDPNEYILTDSGHFCFNSLSLKEDTQYQSHTNIYQYLFYDQLQLIDCNNNNHFHIFIKPYRNAFELSRWTRRPADSATVEKTKGWEERKYEAQLWRIRYS